MKPVASDEEIKERAYRSSGRGRGRFRFSGGLLPALGSKEAANIGRHSQLFVVESKS